MELMELKHGQIVTVDFENSKASNTFIFERYIKDKKPLLVQLYHPLYPYIMVEKRADEINTVASYLKDSAERSLDYVSRNKNLLDFNSISDLDALCMYFVVKRKLTPRQKSILANLAGAISAIIFNNDIKDAINYIVENEAVLDDFNRMWYNNFLNLFKGNQLITSKKQRSAIFNMAGFVLGELENPSVAK